MGFLNDIFGGLFDDPAKSAEPYLNKIPGQLHQGYDPYVKAGQQALPQLQQQYGQLLGQGGNLSGLYQGLLSNPDQTLNMLGQGYHESPGYQFQLKQGLNAAGNAAAAGGMLGSGQHQQEATRYAEGIANEDFNNYLSKALGLYGTGMQGAQNQYDTGLQGLQGLQTQGYGASTGLADSLATALGNQAGLGYAGTANQNQMYGGLIGNLLSYLSGGGSGTGGAGSAIAHAAMPAAGI